MQLLNRRREMGAVEEPFDGFLIRGKFTDDSTPENWKLNINSPNYYTARPVDISQYVDPTTKEFEYICDEKPTTLILLTSGLKIEHIYDIRGTEFVTSCERMCAGSKLISFDFKNFKSDSLKSTRHMLYFAGSLLELKNLAQLDVSRVTNFGGTFSYSGNFTELDLSNFNTENGTTFENFFNGAISLKEINLSKFDTNKCLGSYVAMFNNCQSIEYLDATTINFSNATNLSNLFAFCYKLAHLKVNIDFSNVTALSGMFNQCKALKKIEGAFSNLSLSISLEHSPLDNESAMVLINGLAEVEETQTITFSKSTYDTLTTDQIAIATAKNWEVKFA